MNPYFLLAIVVSVGVAVTGSYYQGRKDGENHCIAEQARDEAVAQIASDAAASAAAKAISQIEIRHTTVRQQAQTEIRREPVYIDCRHPESVKRMLDSALTNHRAASQPSSDRELSDINSAR